MDEKRARNRRTREMLTTEHTQKLRTISVPTIFFPYLDHLGDLPPGRHRIFCDGHELFKDLAEASDEL